MTKSFGVLTGIFGLITAGFFFSPRIQAAEMEHITVYRDETLYLMTPWILKLRSGELVLTAREAHVRRKEHRGHTDPTARGILLRSRDGGRTWGEKTVVDDETYRFSQTEDVPVTQLSDGTLLLNMYSWSVSPLPVGFPSITQSTMLGLYKAPPTAIYTLEGLSLLRSTDEGRTWSPRQSLQIPGLPPLVARCPAIELPDGTLLLSVAAQKSAVVPERGRRTFPFSDWVIRSTDRGKTWGDPVLVAEDPEHDMWFVESGIVRLRSGKIIIMHRTENFLYQSESVDNGKSWSGPKKTPMWGWVAHLLELSDGRLLCTYGYRKSPFGVRACISRDGGKTWDIKNELVLRDDGGNWDLGYPSSVELPDGRVLTVYWINHEKEGDPKSETRYIAGTFYRP